MDFTALLDSELFKWVVLPVLIFVSRVFDVSIGTMRIIFVSRGKKFLAPFLGFFEVLVWIAAMGQIMQNLNNFACYLAYAGGFAMGSFVGIILEEKLALGILIVRVILVKDECKLKERLHKAGYGVTVVDAYGANGKVKIIYTVIKRKDLRSVMDIIHSCNSKAFISVEDARKVSQGVFPSGQQSSLSLGNYNWLGKYRVFKPFRKGK